MISLDLEYPGVEALEQDFIVYIHSMMQYQDNECIQVL